MKLSHTWLQTFFEKPIPTASELADLFTFHSFEIEGVENGVIDAKILPDRAHFCLSHKGIAEEISVLTGQSLKPNRIPQAPAATLDIKPVVTITDTAFCNRYSARYVENIHIGPSSEWISSMLTALGQRSINTIVDATNINMFDIGQPLHAFDADKIRGNIVVRAAKDGEEMQLLDARDPNDRSPNAKVLPGVFIKLTSNDFVIADDEGPLAIAGVKGGKRAGVTAETKRLVIEAAHFNPACVRRTSTRLNLRNESSKRFENEITPELAAEGMNNMCALIAEMCPEARFGPVVDIYPVKPTQTVIELDPAFVNQRLGIDIPEKAMKDILGRMSIGVAGEKSWSLTIPFHRLDLTCREDIVEEIGRVYGYEKIVNTPLPQASLSGVNVEFYITEKIKNTLVGEAGFSEVMLYTLVPKGDLEVAYPLASDKAYLRTTLTPLMLKSLESNARNADLLGLEAVKQFEIGHIFTKNGGSQEYISLAIGAVQVKKVKGVKSEMIVAEAFNTLSKALGLASGSELKPIMKTEGNCVVGEVVLDSALLAAIKTGVYTDLGFNKAIDIVYKPFSVYPFIVRDIALFVSGGETADDVKKAIVAVVETAAGKLLVKGPDLFDSFSKDGKTSYAFRMIFQSAERTLSIDEINAVMDTVYGAVKAKGWEVR
jgi:phenylalanyl-tRNA synthetase beta chain